MPSIVMPVEVYENLRGFVAHSMHILEQERLTKNDKAAVLEALNAAWKELEEFDYEIKEGNNELGN